MKVFIGEDETEIVFLLGRTIGGEVPEGATSGKIILNLFREYVCIGAHL